MARSSYSQGVPDVSPQTGVPSDYQNIPTQPAQFGATIAQGEEALGKGTLAAGHFYGQVAADQATNNFLNETNKVLYGDPDGGTPGLYGLRGQAAMEAGPAAIAKIKNLRDQLREQLSTPDSALLFDQNTRRMQFYLESEVGRHVEQQSNLWANEVGKATDNNTLQFISQHADDPEQVNHGIADLMQSRLKQLQVTAGLRPTNDLINSTLLDARRDAVQARVQALMPANPGLAKQILDDPKEGGLLRGPQLDALQNRADAHASRLDRDYDKAFAAQYFRDPATPYNPPSQRGGGALGGPQAAIGAPPDQALPAIRQYESAGNYKAGYSGGDVTGYPARPGYHGFPDWPGEQGPQGITHAAGAYQFEPETWRKYAGQTGVEDFSPASQDKVASAAYQAEGFGPWAPYNPRLAKAVGWTGATGAARAQEIPTSPATAAAAATARPDLEGRVNQILSAPFPDDLKNRLIAEAHKQDAQWRLAHASDQRQLRGDITNNIAALEAGKDVPLIPDDRIRAFASNPDAADDLIQKQQDAKELGSVIANAQTMSLAEMGQKQSELDAATRVPGVHDFAMRQKQAEVFRRATRAVREGMGTDPVDYLGGNDRTIIQDQEYLRALHDGANTPDGAAAYQAANQKYVGDLLAAQERFGLPPEMQHVLSKGQAEQTASRLMGNPADAPAALKTMAQQWGQNWPSVWRDLSTVGKLPAAYQLVGALDNEHDAVVLARAIAQGKTGDKSIEELIDKGDTGATRPSVEIRKGVLANEDLGKYEQSLRNEGASSNQIRGIVDSVVLLAHAKVFEDGEEVSGATQKAIASAIGRYEFWPNGGARVPREVNDAVSENAREHVRSLTLDQLTIPALYQEHQPGLPTSEDWLNLTKANPSWVTVGQAVRLKDAQNRFVLDKGGKFIEVSFSVARLPARESPPPGSTFGALAPE